MTKLCSKFGKTIKYKEIELKIMQKNMAKIWVKIMT